MHQAQRHPIYRFTETHKLRPSLACLAVLSLLLLLAPQAISQEILIDLGDNFSLMGDQNWNSMVYNVAVSDLIDNAGNPTGISATPFFWTQDYQNSNNWIEDLDWVLKEAATDHFGSFFDSRVVFGNLSDTTLYTLEVVIAHPQTNHLTDATVNEQFASANFQNIPGVNGDNFDPDVDGRDAQNWLIWEDITPSSGTITFRVLKLAGTSAISVSAMRLRATGIVSSDSISVSLSSEESSLPEPGGNFDYQVQVNNTGDSSVEITSLTDDTFGDLNGQGDCSLPFTVDVDQSYSCNYSASWTGNPDPALDNSVTASGTGSFNFVIASDSNTVALTDALPTAAVSKSTICQDAIAAPGGTVLFEVRIENTSMESIELTDLFDDQHGDLNGQFDCSVPQTLQPGATYSCNYEASVTGMAGDSETSTLTATFNDDEMNMETAQGSKSISIQDANSFVFVDCFESGDLGGWSEVVGQQPMR